jgi:hypothetical protein
MFSHLFVYIVDRRFGAYEALKIGLNQDFEGGGFLVDGAGQEVQAMEQIIGGGTVVDFGEEHGG